MQEQIQIDSPFNMALAYWKAHFREKALPAARRALVAYEGLGQAEQKARCSRQNGDSITRMIDLQWQHPDPHALDCAIEDFCVVLQRSTQLSTAVDALFFEARKAVTDCLEELFCPHVVKGSCAPVAAEKQAVIVKRAQELRDHCEETANALRAWHEEGKTKGFKDEKDRRAHFTGVFEKIEVQIDQIIECAKRLGVEPPLTVSKTDQSIQSVPMHGFAPYTGDLEDILPLQEPLLIAEYVLRSWVRGLEMRPGHITITNKQGKRNLFIPAGQPVHLSDSLESITSGVKDCEGRTGLRLRAGANPILLLREFHEYGDDTTKKIKFPDHFAYVYPECLCEAFRNRRLRQDGREPGQIESPERKTGIAAQLGITSWSEVALEVDIHRYKVKIWKVGTSKPSRWYGWRDLGIPKGRMGAPSPRAVLFGRIALKQSTPVTRSISEEAREAAGIGNARERDTLRLLNRNFEEAFGLAGTPFFRKSGENRHRFGNLSTKEEQEILAYKVKTSR